MARSGRAGVRRPAESPEGPSRRDSGRFHAPAIGATLEQARLKWRGVQMDEDFLKAVAKIRKKGAFEEINLSVYLENAFVGGTPQDIVEQLAGLSDHDTTSFDLKLTATDPADKQDSITTQVESTESDRTLVNSFGQ